MPARIDMSFRVWLQFIAVISKGMMNGRSLRGEILCIFFPKLSRCLAVRIIPIFVKNHICQSCNSSSGWSQTFGDVDGQRLLEKGRNLNLL